MRVQGLLLRLHARHRDVEAEQIVRVGHVFVEEADDEPDGPAVREGAVGVGQVHPQRLELHPNLSQHAEFLDPGLFEARVEFSVHVLVAPFFGLRVRSLGEKVGTKLPHGGSGDGAAVKGDGEVAHVSQVGLPQQWRTLPSV